MLPAELLELTLPIVRLEEDEVLGAVIADPMDVLVFGEGNGFGMAARQSLEHKGVSGRLRRETPVLA